MSNGNAVNHQETKMSDILSGFFGEQGQCSDCQCEIDIDREFCQDCLDKNAEELAETELAEAGVTYRPMTAQEGEVRKDGERVVKFRCRTAYEPKATEALAALRESKEKAASQQASSRKFDRDGIPLSARRNSRYHRNGRFDAGLYEEVEMDG